MSYKDIDQHALNAPPAAERTVERLASYLARPTQEPELVARSIFRWITDRITYGDNPCSHPQNGGDPTPEQVLTHRRALCGGYARLFQALGAFSGLEVSLIPGHVKGRGYTIGRHFRGEGDHLWNGVRLGNSWGLVDATWGAGVVQGEGFKKELQDHYFLTPPKQMILDHYPDDPIWQLVEKPLSLTAFETSPIFKPPYFALGLNAFEMSQGTLEALSDFSTTIEAPPNVVLMAELWSRGRPLPRTLTFVQQNAGRVIIHARFPRPGTYILRIYAKKTTEERPFQWAMDYRLQSKRGWEELPAFPEIFAAFGKERAQLLTPLAGRLKPGEKHHFRLIVPEAEEVVVTNNGTWETLNKEGQTFHGHSLVKKGHIAVVAKFPGEKSYPILLRYQGK